jgi:hypothetical protein
MLRGIACSRTDEASTVGQSKRFEEPLPLTQAPATSLNGQGPDIARSRLEGIERPALCRNVMLPVAMSVLISGPLLLRFALPVNQTTEGCIVPVIVHVPEL